MFFYKLIQRFIDWSVNPLSAEHDHIRVWSGILGHRISVIGNEMRV